MNVKIEPKEGWIVNPNANVVRGILNGLHRTDGECPCVNDSDDKHCPCSNYRLKDHCCCGLYIKKDEVNRTTEENLRCHN